MEEQAIDANGCEIIDSVLVDQMTGLEDFSEITHFNVFPNTSGGNVFLEMDFDENLDIQVQLFNSIGQEVILIQLQNCKSCSRIL